MAITAGPAAQGESGAVSNLPNGKWEPSGENGGVLTLTNGEQLISKTVTDRKLVTMDLLIFPNGQKFASETAKSGPHVPFVSKDGSLVAIERRPATKTGMIYIYVKDAQGKYREVENVNAQVSELLADVPGGWDEAAKEHLSLRKLSGRTLTLWSIAHHPPTYRKYQFELNVAPDGSLSLARRGLSSLLRR